MNSDEAHPRGRGAGDRRCDRSPEARYPVAIEQAYATARWITSHGRDEGLDPSRLAVAGDSVGGNMTAAVAILAKQRGERRTARRGRGVRPQAHRSRGADHERPLQRHHPRLHDAQPVARDRRCDRCGGAGNSRAAQGTRRQVAAGRSGGQLVPTRSNDTQSETNVFRQIEPKPATAGDVPQVQGRPALTAGDSARMMRRALDGSCDRARTLTRFVERMSPTEVEALRVALRERLEA